MSKLRTLEWTVRVALVDGKLDAKEREALESLADKCDVPRDRLEALLAEAASASSESAEPRSPTEARQWLESMVRLAVADGRVSRAEMKLLEPAGARINYTAVDLRHMVRKEHRRLYRESREQLRLERSSSGGSPSSA